MLLSVPRSSRRSVEALQQRLPDFEGRAIRIRFLPALTAGSGKLYSNRAAGRAVHAGTFIRKRRMVLDQELVAKPRELVRILTHEIFHFVWRGLETRDGARTSNFCNKSESRRARGELGWSAQLRKSVLAHHLLRPTTFAKAFATPRHGSTPVFHGILSLLWPSGIASAGRIGFTPTFRAAESDIIEIRGKEMDLLKLIRAAGFCVTVGGFLVSTACSNIPEAGFGPRSVKAAVKPDKDRKTAPEFVLKDSNGQTVHLADYKGKVVLLDFWATGVDLAKWKSPGSSSSSSSSRIAASPYSACPWMKTAGCGEAVH